MLEVDGGFTNCDPVVMVPTLTACPQPAGRQLRKLLTNNLSEGCSIHWLNAVAGTKVHVVHVES